MNTDIIMKDENSQPLDCNNIYPKYFKINKSKNDKNEYTYKILKNKLKCILIYDKSADKSAAALTVNVGSLCDPEEYHGLAHFLEHMLFMGTEKYPNENDFSEFLSKNSGDSNAYTGLECTQYYFDVKNESFIEALDKFAQFFISPTFNKSAVEREMKAVESEHKKNMRSDTNRFLEIFRCDSNPSTPFCKFQTGNLETLRKPNIRKALKKFHEEYYSSNLMNLCILSNIPLDQLEQIVDEKFGTIKEHPIELSNIRKSFIPEELYPYTPDNNLGYFYEIKNIKDKNYLSFYFIINENVRANKMYKYDPLEYVVSLIHHEGKGSLISSLQKDELISDLDSSYEVIAHTFTYVYINAHLTNKGLGEYKKIIERVLTFINKLKELPINKEYFDEIRTMTHVDFENFEKDEPVNFCSDMSENMAYYEPEDILTGAYLIEYFDEELIRKYLGMLNCDNMNVYLCINNFDESRKEVLNEKWYDAKYTKVKVNFNDLISQNDYFNDYFGPVKNLFIPKNFELKKFEEKEEDYVAPKIISKKENCHSIWYKPDFKFKIPKAYLNAQIYFPFVPLGNFCKNEFTQNKIFNNLDYSHFEVYLNLWRDIFNEELKETIYLGSLSRIDFVFYNTKMGLTMQLSGFNDTLKLFAEKIFTQFKHISDYNNIENFKNKLLLKIESRLRIEKNSFMSSANAQVANKLNALLTFPHVPISKSIEILEELKEEIQTHNTFLKFEFFLKNYFNHSYFEWLVQGNILPEESIDIALYIQNLLQKEGMKLIEINQIRTTKLSSDYNFYHIFESMDVGNENSAVISYFQVGYLTEKESCMLELIEQILYDKFFDELRTKQALGYLVSLSHKFHRKIEGIGCLVQSNVQSPEFILERINKFFDDFNLTDETNLSDSDFSSHKDALINVYKLKDLTLYEEVDRHFGEIKIREYVYDRDARKIKIIESEITKKDVIDFYEEHFIRNVRRIDVELIGNNHKKENEKYLNKSLNKNKDNDEEFSYPERVEVKNDEVLKRMCELYPDYYFFIKNN